MPITALFFEYFIQFIIALAKMYFPARQQASLAKAKTKNRMSGSS